METPHTPEKKIKTYVDGLVRALHLSYDWSHIMYIRNAINGEIILENRLIAANGGVSGGMSEAEQLLHDIYSAWETGDDARSRYGWKVKNVLRSKGIVK